VFVDVCDPRSLNHDRFRRLRTHDLGQSDEAMFHCSRHRSVVDGFAQKRRPGRGGRRANERCGKRNRIAARAFSGHEPPALDGPTPRFHNQHPTVSFDTCTAHAGSRGGAQARQRAFSRETPSKPRRSRHAQRAAKLQRQSRTVCNAKVEVIGRWRRAAPGVGPRAAELPVKVWRQGC
jgi:hypothetical protein